MNQLIQQIESEFENLKKQLNAGNPSVHISYAKDLQEIRRELESIKKQRLIDKYSESLSQ